MSLPTFRQAYAFLGPLKGKSSTFLVRGRTANAVVSRFILGCLSAAKLNIAVLDTSTFLGTNMPELTDGLPKEFLQKGVIEYLADESDEELSLAGIIATEASVIWIDDMNAVLHLLSSGGQRSGIHRLSTFYHTLSYNARTNNTIVLGTVYKPTFGTATAGIAKRSLPKLSDLQISAELRTGEVVFRCHEMAGWPAEGFVAPLYLEERT